MPKKSRAELANSFYVNRSDIASLLDISRSHAYRMFAEAQRTDRNELKQNYYNENNVRLSTVLRVAGISDEELKKKVSASQASNTGTKEN